MKFILRLSPPSDGVSTVKSLPCTQAAPPFLMLWHLIRWVSLSCQGYLPSLFLEYFSFLNILKTVIRGREFTPFNIFPPALIALKCITHSVPPAGVKYLPGFLLKLSALPPAQFLKVSQPIPHLVFPLLCSCSDINPVPYLWTYSFLVKKSCGRILRCENSAGSLGCNVQHAFFFGANLLPAFISHSCF